MKTILGVAAMAAACAMTTAAQAATVTVYNATQFDTAVKSAKAGDTIRVAPGHYGAYEFRDVNPRSAISVVAADPANLPVFTSLKVTASSNLKFTKLIVSAPEPALGAVVYGATVTRSSAIRMTGMVFRGVTGGGVGNEPRGLRLSQSANITVSGNSFSELSHALTTDGSTRMIIMDNGFNGIRVDGIITDGATNSTISRNRFDNFRPEAGDHADAIQVFNNGHATRNLTVSDNLMIGGARGQMQGVFVTNASSDRAQLDQVRITNNLMWGTMYNGIAAFTGNSVTVTGNKLFSNTALGGAPKTWVRLEDISGAAVKYNYAGAFIYDALGSLSQGGNTVSLLDALAPARISIWDATHVAAQLSLPYSDAGNAKRGKMSREVGLARDAYRSRALRLPRCPSRPIGLC